jgi:hypothetical protein
VLPPDSQIGPISAPQRKALLEQSIVAGVYEQVLDRASAYEALKGSARSRMAGADTQGRATASDDRADKAPTQGGAEPGAAPERGMLDGLGDLLGGGTRRTRTSVGEQLLKSAASSIGREVGRQIIRGVLGGIFGGSRR